MTTALSPVTETIEAGTRLAEATVGFAEAFFIFILDASSMPLVNATKFAMSTAAGIAPDESD